MTSAAYITCILALAATTLSVLVQGRNDTACLRQNGRYILCVRTRFINLPATKEKYSLKPAPTGSLNSSSEGHKSLHETSVVPQLPEHEEKLKPFAPFKTNNNNHASDGIQLQNGTRLVHGILPILMSGLKKKNISNSGTYSFTYSHNSTTSNTSNSNNPSGLLDTIIGSFGRRPFPSSHEGSSAVEHEQSSIDTNHDDLDQSDFFPEPPSSIPHLDNTNRTNSSSNGDQNFITSTDFDLPQGRFPPFEFEPIEFPTGFRDRECPPPSKARQGPKLTPKVIKGGKPVYVDSDQDKDVEYPLVQIPIPDQGFNCVLVSVDFEHVSREDKKKGRNANLMVEFRKSYYGDQDCYGNFVDF